MRSLWVLGAVVLAMVMFSVASAESTVTVQLNPVNNSGISGTATLTAMGNQTQVQISLTGEPAGDSEPAHIHVGQCGPTLGAVKFPLKNVEGGTSTTIVNVPLESLQNGQFAINVHKSAAEIQTYVACGNIPVLATMTSAPSSLPRTGGAPPIPVALASLGLLGVGYLLRRRLV